LLRQRFKLQIMKYYIKILIDRLEWVEDDTLLVGKYRNMKMKVKVKGNEVLDVDGWAYRGEDWDIMYEIIDHLNEIKYLIEQKFLYGAS